MYIMLTYREALVLAAPVSPTPAHLLEQLRYTEHGSPAMQVVDIDPLAHKLTHVAHLQF